MDEASTSPTSAIEARPFYQISSQKIVQRRTAAQNKGNGLLRGVVWQSSGTAAGNWQDLVSHFHPVATRPNVASSGCHQLTLVAINNVTIPTPGHCPSENNITLCVENRDQQTRTHSICIFIGFTVSLPPLHL